MDGIDTAKRPSSIDEQTVKIENEVDDALDMGHLGKKQELKRRFNLWSAIGLSFCITASWEGISAAMFTALYTGGATGLVWGFLVVGAGSLCVAASLAEIASTWPTTGAMYHWTAELSPSRSKAFLSWLVGCFNIGSLMLATLGMSFAVGVQVQAYAMLGANYHDERWHAVMIAFACIFIYIAANIFGVNYFAKVNVSAMGVHVTFFVVVFIVLLACSDDKNSAKYVFAELDNLSGWSSDGLAFCVGLLSPAMGFIAVDGPAHFSEEMIHASRNVPRAIFYAVAATVALTFPWLIGFAFSMGALEDIVSAPYAYYSPMTQVLYLATNNKAGSIFLSAGIIYVGFIGGMDLVGSGARTIWAMARDNAFPKCFRTLHPKYNIPHWAILVSTLPLLPLAIIYIWNTTAFYGIISGILITQIPTYLIPIGLHLFSRERHLGPWNLGKFGRVVNAISVLYLVFLLIFLCFPMQQPVTDKNMNYASVIFGAVGILATIGYFAYARGRYFGPIIEIDAPTEALAKLDKE